MEAEVIIESSDESNRQRKREREINWMKWRMKEGQE